MPVYQATFKSGAQQFFEMDKDDANSVSQTMFELASGNMQVNPVYQSTCGATLDCADLSGFQHYIPKGYATLRAHEGGATADFNEAMDEAISAMMDTAEVETGIAPDGSPYVAAVDREAVLAAFLAAMERTPG